MSNRDTDIGLEGRQRRRLLGAASASLGLASVGAGAVTTTATADRAALTRKGTVTSLQMSVERATPEQIGVYMPISKTVGDTASASIRYRVAGTTAWRDAHPALRIRPEWTARGAPVTPVAAFAGTIFDLTPGTAYEVELTLTDPGKPTQRLTTTASTRALPPVAPAVTQRVMPGDNLQTKLSALVPGDVLEISNGTYNVSGLALSRSGTAASPIYIRGASREGVVLKSASRVLQLQTASHVVIENLTIEGTGVDAGGNASSMGVAFSSGAVQEFVTLRDLDLRGVDQGIVATGATRSILVYNCTLRGNNTWTPEMIHTNLTWNDDGIRLPGQGNAAFQNTLHGFGDALAVNDGVLSAAVYFYRNRITMTCDDAFEGDYATRNIGFYDNYITNCATLLSLDPLWGGPLYCFRNIAINPFRGPFKLNDINSGFMIYNNTIVRTEGQTGWGWAQYNNGALKSWSFRNNLFIYRGTTGQLLSVSPTGNTPIDFTHNAWFPDGQVWWTNTGGSFGSLAAAAASLPATTPVFGTATARHYKDLISASDPFVTPIVLGPDHLTEVATSTVPSLRADAGARAAGIAIPNITDGYAGAEPEIGAMIEGRGLVTWGAVR